MWVFYQVYFCIGMLPFSSDLGEVLSVFRFFFLGLFDLVCLFVGFCPFVNKFLSIQKKKKKKKLMLYYAIFFGNLLMLKLYIILEPIKLVTLSRIR